MRSFMIKLILIIILNLAFPAVIQEYAKLSPKEFVVQYQGALQRGNEQELHTLFQNNEDLIPIILQLLYKEGNETYLLGHYELVSNWFISILDLTLRLDDKTSEETLVKIVKDMHLENSENMEAVIQNMADFLRKKGDNAYQTVDYDGALRAFTRAIEFYQVIMDQTGKGETFSSIGLIYQQTADYQKALEVYQDALRLSKESDNRNLEGEIQRNIGATYQKTSDNRNALFHYLKAFTIKREIGNREGEEAILETIRLTYCHKTAPNATSADVLYKKGVEAFQTADNELAAMAFTTVLDLYQRSNDKQGEKTVLGELGKMHQKNGEYQQALTCYQAALQIEKELGNNIHQTDLLQDIGAIYETNHDYQRAVDVYQIICQQTADYQKELEVYQDALKLSKENGDRNLEGEIHCNIGATYQKISDERNALFHYLKAFAIKKEIGDREGEEAIMETIRLTYFRTIAPSATSADALDKKTAADILYKKGVEALQTEDDELAVMAFKFALELYQRFNDKQGEKTVLREFGKMHQKNGEYQQALTYYQAALQIEKELGNSINQTNLLQDIGAVYEINHDYQRALDAYQEAFELNNQIRDQVRRRVIVKKIEKVYQHIIGKVYLDTDEYQQALRYSQEALKIHREVGDHTQEWKTLNQIGLIYGENSDYEEALSYLVEALEIIIEIEDDTGKSTILKNIETFYQKSSDKNREYAQMVAYREFKKGMQAYETAEYETALTALMVSRELFHQFEVRQGEAITLAGIGGIYLATGEYQLSLSYYQETLSISRKIGHKTLEGKMLNIIGGVYLATNESQQALRYYQDALTIQRELGDKAEEGMILNNIGGIYRNTGEFQQALNYHQEALNISKKIRDKTLEGISLGNIGEIHQNTGEYQQALDYYQQSLKIMMTLANRVGEKMIREKIMEITTQIGEQNSQKKTTTIFPKTKGEEGEERNKDRTQVIAADLLDKGMRAYQRADYKTALAMYMNALNQSRQFGDKQGEEFVLNGIGLVYWKTGDYQQALTYLNANRQHIVEPLAASTS